VPSSRRARQILASACSWATNKALHRSLSSRIRIVSKQSSRRQKRRADKGKE
jgi:hypothetical protein